MANDHQSSTSMLPITDVYNQVRAQIQHEDDLVSQKLNWFLTSQSFLFTAYAIVYGNFGVVTAPDGALRATLMSLIPMIAITVGLLIFIAVVAGALVMRQLRVAFVPHHRQAMESGLPPLQGMSYTRAMGLAAPLALPVVFIVVWTMLIFHVHIHS